MIGSRNLAINVQKQIDRFIMNNLHLKIKQNKIINCNEDSIKFLGFKIYFVKSHKKIKVIWNQYRGIVKYRNKVFARIKQSDERLAKVAIFELKKNLIKAFRINFSKLGKNLVTQIFVKLQIFLRINFY
jgi:hypothetical protein